MARRTRAFEQRRACFLACTLCNATPILPSRRQYWSCKRGARFDRATMRSRAIGGPAALPLEEGQGLTRLDVKHSSASPQ
eukprot:4859173-Amphidinium_carterae.1